MSRLSGDAFNLCEKTYHDFVSAPELPNTMYGANAMRVEYLSMAEYQKKQLSS